MKKAIYVLTLSKNFMSGHIRQGEPTHFKDQLLGGRKIHTIRAGEYWKKVIDRVNAGEAILSVREWSGAPYKSKQVEIKQFDKLGWQEFRIERLTVLDGRPTIDNRAIYVRELEKVADNDGLNYFDFLQWFRYPKPFKGGIIHFTDFRY